MELERKIAIVTGGAGGIGRRVVERLAAEATRVAVLDLDAAALDELAGAISGVCCRRCDISDSGQVQESVAEIAECLGGVDVLVNNAGIIRNAPLVSLQAGQFQSHDVATWDQVIATNLSGTFYVTRSVVQQMVARRTRGVIVNVSSVCAAGNPGQSAYSASKAALEALTTVWAGELGPLRIRVAGIAPGYTQTQTTLSSMSEAVIKQWKASTPLRRFAEIDEIAQGVLFILRNDFFNGRILQLDGGLRL